MPICMPGFARGIWVADDGARAYTTLAEHWYNVRSTLLLDCVVPVKGFGSICINVRLLISLLRVLSTACFDRFHE